MTVNVDEQNYRREQSYNLALAIWSLVEQNAASLRAEGASDATVGVVQRNAVARILAEVCYATDGKEDELISEFSETYSHIRFNPELSLRHRGEPEEPADDFRRTCLCPAGQSLWRSPPRPGQLSPGSKDFGNESVFALHDFPHELVAATSHSRWPRSPSREICLPTSGG